MDMTEFLSKMALFYNEITKIASTNELVKISLMPRTKLTEGVIPRLGVR